MIKKLIKKMMCGIGFLLAVTAVVIGVITLRFALWAPDLLNSFFVR